MAPRAAGLLLHHLRRLTTGHAALTPDRELLRRFVARRDEAAFAALVGRHGPMVLRVCRRVLPDADTAEDAFQAAFLVLARKAGAIARRELLANWLYGVAYRVAARARAEMARRRDREKQAAPRLVPDPLAEVTARELCGVLDEELTRLPPRYRLPVVMCHLEGQTRDQVARQLGWSVRTLARRLERGRELLRARLTRRGVALPAALLIATLTGAPTSAAVPAALAASAVKLGLSGGAAPAKVAALAEGVLKAMSLNKLKTAVAVLAVLALAGAGVGVVGSRVAAVGLRAEEGPSAPAEEPGVEGRRPRADLYGDPLPEGAVMRLGTLLRRAVGAKLALSPDGKSIIGVRAGKYVSVWDAATGKLRETRELPVQAWNSWLSADGRRLVTDAPGGSTITVWDVQTGKKLHTLTIKGGGYIMPAAFSPDGKRVAAVANADGQRVHYVHAWDLADGKEVFAKEVRVLAGSGVLAFSPDGKKLLAAFTSSEEGMHCWDIATGQQLWQNKEFVPSAMAFTPDGKILSPMDKLAVVDLATGQPVKLDKMPPLTWDMRPTLTPDGRTLLLSTAEGVIVWDMAAGKELHQLAGAGEEVLVAPDSKTIITNRGALQRWDLGTGKPLYADNYEQGHVGEVRAVVFSADGKRLASASADGSVRLWDVTTGKPLHVWRGHEAQRPVALWRWIKAGVSALDMTPDGRWVLSAGSEEKLRLRDAATGKEVLSIALPGGENGESERRIFHLRLSADGTKAVALFGAEGFTFVTGQTPPKHTYKLATWDLKTGKLVTWHPVEIRPARSSAISPDGRTLLSEGVLVDVASGREGVRLEGLAQQGSGEPMAFSPDGTLVVGVFPEVTKKDGQTYVSPGGVRVWETATGKTVAHLKTKSWVGQVAVHPDNRFVVTNDWDGVQLWDATTGKVVATRPMPERVPSSTTSGSYASCLAFTPDGRRLATGHPDSTILIWDLPPPTPKPAPLAAGELDALWNDLTAADARTAWRAVWRMAEVPTDVLPQLRDRLKPVEPAAAERTRRLLADLDADSFEKRQEAAKRLKELGPLAEPALRQALEAGPSAEQHRRIKEVLAALATPAPPSGDEVRALRAVAVLERVGGAEARAVLAELAKGVPEARLTRAARAALDRQAR